MPSSRRRRLPLPLVLGALGALGGLVGFVSGRGPESTVERRERARSLMPRKALELEELGGPAKRSLSTAPFVMIVSSAAVCLVLLCHFFGQLHLNQGRMGQTTAEGLVIRLRIAGSP